MTEHPAQTSRYVVLCVMGDADKREALVREVSGICQSPLVVEGLACAEASLARVRDLHSPDVRVPFVLVDQTLPDGRGVDLLTALHDRRETRATRKMLLTHDPSAQELLSVLEHGALHRTFSAPWSHDTLCEGIRSLLTSFFIHHAPEDMHHLRGLLDAEQFPRAFESAARARQALDLEIRTLKRSFLGTMDMSDEEVEQAMGAAIDEALGNPPRSTFPEGTVLVRQDDPVDTVSILVSGYVQLSRKANDHEVVLHTHSAGRIVGLLSLAQRQRAFFTCRAITDVTVLPLTFEQLDTALQANPWLSAYFVTTLIRSLSTRSKRTAQLKVEVEHLNRKLRAERDQLADALDNLEVAQMRLVESEKMATLGQLTAGIAHELNNPTAAIRRSVDFIAEDVMSLVMQLPDGDTIKDMMQSALESAPVSTREIRKLARELFAVVGDEVLTRRLVKIGITTPDAFKRRVGKVTGERRNRLICKMEQYHELGTSLRNVCTCADRISDIVASLKSYARSDQDRVDAVDVHKGLEDTLVMLGHDLRDMHVKRSYSELPPITCCAGELNQVWTNLITNALHAMDKGGTLRVETDAPDAGHVRVRVIDSGEGISAEALPRIFDLHFTTKDGRVEFGLGMGLPICRQIVARHGGTITAESRPGRTCFTVTLPLCGSDGLEAEGRP